MWDSPKPSFENSLCVRQCRIKGQGQTELQTAARHGQKDCDLCSADVQQRVGYREVRALHSDTGSLHCEDILIQKSPMSPITTNNSFINDKHALNYVFSELKCSFRAMRKWRMVFLHGDWCCFELKPTLPECTAVLFCLYMLSQAQHPQMGVRMCSFTVNMCSSSVVLFQWGMCLCFRCFGLLLSPGKNVKNSDMHLLDLVGGKPASLVLDYIHLSVPLQYPYFSFINELLYSSGSQLVWPWDLQFPMVIKPQTHIF